MTNLPLADVTDNKAWIVDLRWRAAAARARRAGASAGAAPVFLEERQVGARPADVEEDQPGFWESLGYHNYGDPWKEQRYQGD